MIDATIIPLDFWQAPQGDVILVYSEHECSIYFACWKSAAVPADFIGHLSFERASCVRSFGREYLPYRFQSTSHHSYILQIPDSELLREHVAYRKIHYPNSPANLLDRNHYVVKGHDIYHEILARDFTASTIPKQDLTDPRLLRLIAYA